MKAIQKLINHSILHGVSDQLIVYAQAELNDVNLYGLNKIKDEPSTEEELEQMINDKFGRNYEQKYIDMAVLLNLNPDFIDNMQKEIEQYVKSQDVEELNTTNMKDYV